MEFIKDDKYIFGYRFFGYFLEKIALGHKGFRVGKQLIPWDMVNRVVIAGAISSEYVSPPDYLYRMKIYYRNKRLVVCSDGLVRKSDKGFFLFIPPAYPDFQFEFLSHVGGERLVERKMFGHIDPEEFWRLLGMVIGGFSLFMLLLTLLI